MENKEKEIQEKINNLQNRSLFEKIKFFDFVEKYKSINKKISSILLKFPDYIVEIFIDEDNAILFRKKTSYEYNYSVIVEGVLLNKNYVDREHALLGWIGEKYNSKFNFADLIFKGIKGIIPYDK